MSLLRRINAAIGALAMLGFVIAACVNFDDTATFWKLMGFVGLYLLLDLADEVRKIRRGERA